MHNVGYRYNIMISMGTFQKTPAGHHVGSAFKAHKIILRVGIYRRQIGFQDGHDGAGRAGDDKFMRIVGLGEAFGAERMPTG